MTKETNNATIGFEAELWKAAEKMWGHIPRHQDRVKLPTKAVA